MPALERTSCDLGSVLTREQISPALRAKNRWEAIDELISLLVDSGKIKLETRDSITAAVNKRESSMSTGIGFGVGIPHASTEAIDEVVAAVGRSQDGIAFDALDGKPVHLVVLLLIPKGAFQKHLHTVAGVARLLHHPEFRSALQAAPDADAIFHAVRQPKIS